VGRVADDYGGVYANLLREREGLNTHSATNDRKHPRFAAFRDPLHSRHNNPSFGSHSQVEKDKAPYCRFRSLTKRSDPSLVSGTRSEAMKRFNVAM